MKYRVALVCALGIAFIISSPPTFAAMDSMPSESSNKNGAMGKRFPSAKERVEQNRGKPLSVSMKNTPMKKMSSTGMESKNMKKSMGAKRMPMKKMKSMKKSMKKAMKGSKVMNNKRMK